jgi:hypothetical protein
VQPATKISLVNPFHFDVAVIDLFKPLCFFWQHCQLFHLHQRKDKVLAAAVLFIEAESSILTCWLQDFVVAGWKALAGEDNKYSSSNSEDCGCDQNETHCGFPRGPSPAKLME